MKKSDKSGFTLVELIMVVAIIALISTLAVTKLSGYKLNAERQLSLANMTRIAAGVETFLAAEQKLNRLDFLVDQGTAVKASSAGTYSEDNSVFLTGNGVPGQNTGLFGGLREQLCQYYLTTNDVAALADDLGFKLGLQSKTASSSGFYGEDGSMCVGVANSPLMCSCYAKTNEVGLAVAMVNPCAVSAQGRLVGFLPYQACGQDVRVNAADKLVINGTTVNSLAEAFARLNAKGGGGILLAMGLGDGASIVGNNKGGLDSAPVCPVVKGDVYPRYILLLRLKTISSTVRRAEFAGVLDAKGRIVGMAREDVEN